MERNNTKLIVVSQHAMMTWGPILEQLFEQCHCSDRFSVCGFEEFLLHSEYGTPYIIVLDSEDDCLQAANILHNFSVCVMNYDLPVKLDTKKLDKCKVLTYSTSVIMQILQQEMRIVFKNLGVHLKLLALV